MQAHKRPASLLVKLEIAGSRHTWPFLRGHAVRDQKFQFCDSIQRNHVNLLASTWVTTAQPMTAYKITHMTLNTAGGGADGVVTRVTV